jgi:hypothetical protein
MDVMAPKRRATPAREIVWFWRSDAGAKLAERSADDGGKKHGHREDHV